MENSKSISVVIPNYNGKELLERNLPSVINALSTSQIKDYEIIIPDDHSDDDSVLFLRRNYPEILVIENKQNKGFAVNTNSGIKIASKELVLILNSDVELSDKYFVPLLPYFDIPDTFGVKSRIIALDNDLLQDSAKYPQYFFGNIKGTVNYISKSKISYYSFFISGANALINRKLLLDIGSFNELYSPYYWEDVDLGLRAWRLGFKLYCNTLSYCRHPNSTTIKKESGVKVKIISKRNKMYLHYLHLNGFELLFYLIKMIFKTVIRLLILDKIQYKAFCQFLLKIKELNVSKAAFLELQKKNKTFKTVKDVVHFIKNDIDHVDIKKF